jgi:hypothetical protein
MNWFVYHSCSRKYWSNVGGTETKTYSVTANGTSSYVFNAKGLPTNNPNFTFKGEVPTLLTCLQDTFLYKYYSRYWNCKCTLLSYKWSCIRKDNFTVPMDAPGTLYYNCQFHGSMEQLRLQTRVLLNI